VLARLRPVKGIDLAIRAIAMLPDVELEIVGEGPERAALMERARALRAAHRVRFTGFDPNPGARLARWRLLLVPSLHEGNPIGVIEALAFGTPVLAGPLPGVDEILDGRGGRLLPDRDPLRWAAAIRDAVDDPAFGCAASAQGRARFAESFTAIAAAQRMLGVYRAALAA
jgi:glycosyltransferase involved in cell wall biosynthesis